MKLLATVLIAIATSADMTTAQEPLPPTEAEIRGWIDQLANKSVPRNRNEGTPGTAPEKIQSYQIKKISSSREHDELILIDHVLGQAALIR